MGQITPYNKTVWYDHIIDVTNGQIIQEGTRFNQSRANNFEDGIEYNRNKIIEQARMIQRLQVQMELDGRAPGNNGTFVDTLDGTTSKITLDTAVSAIKEPVVAGSTTLNVEDGSQFKVFTQVTVFDDVSTETTLITAISGNTLTVQALANGYKKGAKVARSTVAIDKVNKKMDVGNWSTYSVQLVEVV